MTTVFLGETASDPSSRSQAGILMAESLTFSFSVVNLMKNVTGLLSYYLSTLWKFI